MKSWMGKVEDFHKQGTRRHSTTLAVALSLFLALVGLVMAISMVSLGAATDLQSPVVRSEP